MFNIFKYLIFFSITFTIAANVYGDEQQSNKWPTCLNQLQKRLDSLFQDIQKIPESPIVKKLNKDIKQLKKKVKEAGQLADNKLRNEVIPELRKKLDELRSQLKHHQAPSPPKDVPSPIQPI